VSSGTGFALVYFDKRIEGQRHFAKQNGGVEARARPLPATGKGRFASILYPHHFLHALSSGGSRNVYMPTTFQVVNINISAGDSLGRTSRDGTLQTQSPAGAIEPQTADAQLAAEQSLRLGTGIRVVGF